MRDNDCIVCGQFKLGGYGPWQCSRCDHCVHEHFIDEHDYGDDIGWDWIVEDCMETDCECEGFLGVELQAD